MYDSYTPIRFVLEVELMIPCDCGSEDATWHGDRHGLRTYMCEKCYVESRRVSWYPLISKIVEEHQHTFICKKTHEERHEEWCDELDEEEYKPKDKNSMLIDGYTASMLKQVADLLSGERGDKFKALPICQAVNLGWRMIS